jgi:Protein of unknown function (DUF3572)
MTPMGKREAAEILALDALGWLAADEAFLPQFLDSSGLSPDDLHVRASDPDMLLAVLDFLMGDDVRIMAFSAATARSPAAIAEALHQLSGGVDRHWT